MPTAAQVNTEVDRVLANPRANQREVEHCMALVLEQQARALAILRELNSPMSFEYFKSRTDRQWYWHLKAANGEIIASGEGYKKKKAMLEAIALVKKTATTPVGPVKFRH